MKSKIPCRASRTVKLTFATLARRRRALAVCLALCALALSVSASAQKATITSFDAPGAGTGLFQGTFALAINPEGNITGYYVDSNTLAHGFLRVSDGSFVTFDAPDVGTGSFQGTFAFAINPEGKITGYDFDANSIAHGFLRDSDGSFVTFDAPGAGASTGSFLGTLPSAINVEGKIVGAFFDANLASHGFLRSPRGAITQLDDPQASLGSFQGTSAVALNPQGAVVGCYSNSLGVGTGFLRTRGGAFSTLNPAGSSEGFTTGVFCGSSIFSVVQSIAINLPGTITGAYFQPIQGNIFGGNYRGFVHHLDGTFTTFDAVTSPSLPCCTWTFPISINSEGEIAGFDNDFTGVNHGLLRANNGAITLFDAPGAGTGRGQGTVATSINSAGVITGYSLDANFAAHGFLRNP